MKTATIHVSVFLLVVFPKINSGLGDLDSPSITHLLFKIKLEFGLRVKYVTDKT